MDCHWKGQVIGTVGRRPVAIHSSGQTIFSFIYIKGFKLCAGEEVDEVAGGASEIGEVGDSAGAIHPSSLSFTSPITNLTYTIHAYATCSNNSFSCDVDNSYFLNF